MKILAKILPLFLLFGVVLACNTVSKEQLEKVKVGDVIIWRYKKASDGKEWMYAEKITRIEGDTVYFNPSVNEATSKMHPEIQKFDTSREGSITKSELLKYTDVTGEDKKVIIEIK